MMLGPLIHFISYHIGYQPSLEGMTISDTKEAHTIETKEQGHDQDIEIKKANKVKQKAEKEEDKYGHMSEIYLLIATIVATVTFQAAFQIPGGYDDHGQPNLADDFSFKAFLLYNSMSFGLSAFLMFFHFIVAFFPRQFRVPYPRLLILLISELSLTFMILAFMSTVNTQNSTVAVVAGYGACLPFFIPFFLIGILYMYFYLKSVSKYRFPFFSSAYFPTPH